MMNSFYYNSFMMRPFVGFMLIPVIAWTLFWKGWALWKAVKADSKPWFVALLVINTMGILEILYIFLFSKQKYESVKVVKSSKKKSK